MQIETKYKHPDTNLWQKYIAVSGMKFIFEKDGNDIII